MSAVSRTVLWFCVAVIDLIMVVGFAALGNTLGAFVAGVGLWACSSAFGFAAMQVVATHHRTGAPIEGES